MLLWCISSGRVYIDYIDAALEYGPIFWIGNSPFGEC